MKTVALLLFAALNQQNVVDAQAKSQDYSGYGQQDQHHDNHDSHDSHENSWHPPQLCWKPQGSVNWHKPHCWNPPSTCWDSEDERWNRPNQGRPGTNGHRVCWNPEDTWSEDNCWTPPRVCWNPKGNGHWEHHGNGHWNH